MGRSGTSQNMSFPASPMQIYGSKSWIFGLTQDGSNCSRYSSIGKRKIPRIFRPSVRVGAHRAINPGYGAVSAPRPAIEDRLHFCRIPRHDDIGEQAQRIGDRLHFVLALGLIVGDATGINEPLQRIGRLAPIEHAQQLTPECRFGQSSRPKISSAASDQSRHRPHTADHRARRSQSVP